MKISDEYSMKYDVTLKTMPQRYVASLRKVIPSYQDEQLLWEQMGKGVHHKTWGNKIQKILIMQNRTYKHSKTIVGIFGAYLNYCSLTGVG